MRPKRSGRHPLEADGRITRERDPADRRRHVATLAPAGKKHLDRSARAQREAEDEVLAGLSADEREQLRQLLLVLRDRSGCPGETQGGP